MKLFTTITLFLYTTFIFAFGPSGNTPFEVGYGFNYLKNLNNLSSASITPYNYSVSANFWAASGRSANTAENDFLFSFNYAPELNFNNPNFASGNSFSFFLEPIGWDYLEHNKNVDIIFIAGLAYGRTNIKLDNEKFSNSFWGIVATYHFRTFIKRISLGFKFDGILDVSKPKWKAKDTNILQPNGIKQNFVQSSFCLGYKF